jgi:hypothetical protein
MFVVCLSYPWVSSYNLVAHKPGFTVFTFPADS